MHVFAESMGHTQKSQAAGQKHWVSKTRRWCGGLGQNQLQMARFPEFLRV